MSEPLADLGSNAPMDVEIAANPPDSSADVVEIDASDSAPEVKNDSTGNFSVSDGDWELEVAALSGTGDPLTEKVVEAETQVSDDTAKTDTEPPAESITTENEKGKDESDAVKTDGDDSKNNWDSAPEQFREEHKKQREELRELKKNSLEQTYLVDSAKFLDTLKAKSSSQYSAMEQEIATKVATENPDGWIEFFAKNHPDLMVKKLFGDEKLTVARIEAERQTLRDDPDYADSFADWEEPREVSSLTDAERAEFEQLRGLSRERDTQESQKKRADLEMRTAQPIVDTVDRVIRDANLEVLETDTPTVKSFKEFFNKYTRVIVAHELETNPDIAPILRQATNFVDKDDEAGAMQLQFPLINHVEDFMENIAAFATDLIAQSERAGTIPLSPTPPPKVVATSAGAGIGASNGDAKPNLFSKGFQTTDDDWKAAIATLGG